MSGAQMIALASAFAALLAPTLRADGIAEGIVVAFRGDAEPFSFEKDGFYAGFLADLCQEGVVRSRYAMAAPRRIVASDRFTQGGEVDLICDPTTITQIRAREFDFTPIVFIANASFLARITARVLTPAEIERFPDCKARRAETPGLELVAAGMVAGTTARASYDLARADGLLADTDTRAVCTAVFETHDAGIAEVCDGAVSYYFGDVDILRAKSARQETCAATLDRSFFTYEPYALAIPSKDATFRRRFVSAVYEMFADGSAAQFYAAAFGDATAMSDPLSMLFRINSVPQGAADPE